MSVHAEGAIRYDFDGALNLARSIWSLAQSIKTTQGARDAASQTAQEDWLGQYAQDFRDRMHASDNNSQELIGALETLAKQFAQAWADVLYEQQMRDRANYVQNKKNDEWFGEKAANWLFGDHTDENTPKPSDIAVPTPPNFEPTANPRVPWTPPGD